MKILQVITSLETGGAEKLITEIVPLLRKDGYMVDVLLFNGIDTPFKRLLIESGCKIFSLSNGGSVYNPKYILKLRKYLKRYDIVHAHNTASQLFVALSSIFCSVQLCTTEHNTTNRRRNWWWYKPFDRWMYSRYKKIICISDKTKKNLCTHLGVNHSDIVTVYNGINLSKYTNSEIFYQSLRKIQSHKIILMVAGFRLQKDQDTLIRATVLLPNDYHVYFIGDGERRRLCEDLVEQLNLQDRIHFLGIRMDIPELLSGADVVVMSSHWEGFGLAAVEGMSAHKPVIASNVEGLNEIVRGYGILFEQGNEKELALQIKKLLDSPQIAYENIANRCFKRSKDFDISKMVKQYETIYKELFSKKA